jgi:hypothetical protein
VARSRVTIHPGIEESDRKKSGSRSESPSGPGNPIRIKPSHKGLLHKELDVPQGEPIPAAKIAKAAHSSDPAERKRAVFAQNAKKFKH